MIARWLFVGLTLLALPASAQYAGNNPAAAPDGQGAIGIAPPVEGTVSWDLLAQVELVLDDNGMDMVPSFAEDIRGLRGETVKVVGFLMPLDSMGNRMLLSMVSPHCPFCLPGGPESFVELVFDEPVGLTMEPVVIEGDLELLDQGWNGYYYRMGNARVVREVTS